MTYKITRNAKLPEGVKLSKTSKKLKQSATEGFPLTQLNVGDAFTVPGRDARSLRGTIHNKRRAKGAKFVSETVTTRNGGFAAKVYRVK